MTDPHCILYTFDYEKEDGSGTKLVKVARLTNGVPDDWSDWPEQYCNKHPGLRLQEIASIDFVDERGGVSLPVP